MAGSDTTAFKPDLSPRDVQLLSCHHRHGIQKVHHCQVHTAKGSVNLIVGSGGILKHLLCENRKLGHRILGGDDPLEWRTDTFPSCIGSNRAEFRSKRLKTLAIKAVCASVNLVFSCDQNLGERKERLDVACASDGAECNMHDVRAVL